MLRLVVVHHSSKIAILCSMTTIYFLMLPGFFKRYMDIDIAIHAYIDTRLIGKTEVIVKHSTMYV